MRKYFLEAFVLVIVDISLRSLSPKYLPVGWFLILVVVTFEVVWSQKTRIRTALQELRDSRRKSAYIIGGVLALALVCVYWILTQKVYRAVAAQPTTHQADTAQPKEQPPIQSEAISDSKPSDATTAPRTEPDTVNAVAHKERKKQIKQQAALREALPKQDAKDSPPVAPSTPLQGETLNYAPNGFATSGGTLFNPTVNNYGAVPRRLSDQTKSDLKECLKTHSGVFSIVALVNNSEAHGFAEDWYDVFTSAGWTNKNKATPVGGFSFFNRMWSGVQIHLHDLAFAADSPERTFRDCIAGIVLPGKGETAVDKDNVSSGEVSMLVSDAQ